MASLTCLSIFEAGAFGSDAGNVIVPAADTGFPTTGIVYSLMFGTANNSFYFAMGF